MKERMNEWESGREREKEKERERKIKYIRVQWIKKQVPMNSTTSIHNIHL